MVRFKQLLKVMFLNEEHIIHKAHSPGNTYLLTGHFHLINDFTALTLTTVERASTLRPMAVSACLLPTEQDG